MNPKLELTAEQAREGLRGDSKYFEVIEDTIIEATRWSETHDLVVKVGDNFFNTWYIKGLNEEQYEEPWYFFDPKFDYVVPVEVTVIEYKRPK